MFKRSTALRDLMFGKDIFILPFVACALHAKIVEALGFKALGISGGNAASHILGLPDVGLISLTEMVQNAQRICDATGLPVLADCDTGFGNAINVRRTVEAMVQAGAAGLFLEDQVAPKRCGFVKGKEVLPLEEAVGKYRAAVDVRNELDPDFVIMARTDARGAVGGGLEECITRLKAYKLAGVDVVYAEALQSMDEVRAVRSQVEGPFFVTTKALRPAPTLLELQEAGVCMAYVHVASAGVMAMWDHLMLAKEEGLEAAEVYQARLDKHPVGFFGVNNLVGFPKVREWEEKYLPAEHLAKYEQSIGLYDPGQR